MKSHVVELAADKWHRAGTHDGYITGNGQIYIVGGMGWTLHAGPFPTLGQRPVSLTALARVVGPIYGHANFGSDWRIIPHIDGKALDWQSESLVHPTEDRPAWGVRSSRQGLSLELTDIVLPGEPVVVRVLRVTRSADNPPADVSLVIPVSPDWCNAGEKPGSVPHDKLIEVDARNNCLLLRGAKRRLFDDPYSLDFETVYYSRFLATGASVEKKTASTLVSEDGLTLRLGLLKPGETVHAAVWLVTAFTAKNARDTLATLRKKKLLAVVKAAQGKEGLTLKRTDGEQSFMLTAIHNSLRLCQSSQSHCGGVLASPYTYPVNYVRDQQGSFRLFLAAGEFERAYQTLRFHAVMQNKFGIQNAFDAVNEPLDPDSFDPLISKKDAHWKVAEVPSYVILFARDYYQATGDLGRIRPLYDRLAYNVRVQVKALSENDLLPSPGDESYTQLVEIGHQKEFLDSNVLFIAAAEFMVTLAGLLGKSADAAEFRGVCDRVRAAVMKHLWMPQENRFAGSSVDSRPVQDALLRCFWVETENPYGPVAQGCLQAVLKSLVNPIRVVPDRSVCAGMEPGYLLYAMARCQHPQVHEAAQLLLQYASRNGTFCEYYEHRDIESETTFAIQRREGTLRPWESGTCATALLQYLVGLRIHAPQRRLFLQPHLPEGWPGWASGEYDIPGEGSVQFRLERDGKETLFAITRRGGRHPLAIEVEFGAFGPKLASRSPQLQLVPQRPDLLRGVLHCPAGKSKGAVAKHEVRFACG